jgi:predicted aspartyl protease
MQIRKTIYLTLMAWPCLVTAAEAADCGPLRAVNGVQMERDSSGVDVVPVGINGNELKFIFDTGGFTTSISKEAAEKLKLRIIPGFEGGLVNLAGGGATGTAKIDDYTIGRLRGKDLTFPIAPFKHLDGIFSLNFMRPYDIDVDFGTDKLNFFSQEHCPGGVLYWKAAAVDRVPFKIEDGHIAIPVLVDGQKVNAIIDTGASDTVMSQATARKQYRLTFGDEATPLESKADADPKAPKIYSHTFKTLSFGAIDVNNPHVTIFEDVWKRDAGTAQYVGNRTITERDMVQLVPELIVGMNLLRKLHVYFAFGEGNMYISPASTGGAALVK